MYNTISVILSLAVEMADFCVICIWADQLIQPLDGLKME